MIALGERMRIARPSLGQAGDLGISQAEYDEYVSMNPEDKYLFLLAYQMSAALVSEGLTLGGKPYTGPAISTAEAADDYLSLMRVLRNIMPGPVLSMMDQATLLLFEAEEGIAKLHNVVQKFRKLRDRIVEDLVRGGAVVAYERFGDDPRFPGEIISPAVVAPEGSPPGAAPDLVAVFTNKSKAEITQDAIQLQGILDEMGYTLDRPLELGSPGALMVLGILAVVALILWAFWGIYEAVTSSGIHNAKKARVDQAVEAGEMTASEAAALFNAEVHADNETGNWFEQVVDALKMVVIATAVIAAIPLIQWIAEAGKKSERGAVAKEREAVKQERAERFARGEGGRPPGGRTEWSP